MWNKHTDGAVQPVKSNQMDFENTIERACQPGPDRAMAGVVLAAANVSGKRLEGLET